MDLSLLFEFLKFFGLNSPAMASGWLVAIFVCGFMIWRLMIMDKKQEEYIDKISKVIEKQEEEWRALVSKTDEMTFEILKTSTQTMSMLTEKINTLQLLLIQTGKDHR